MSTSSGTSAARLFPVDLPATQWAEFAAEGFAAPVSGVVSRTDQAPCCGVPLGGISTGCLDVDARGVWGYSSIFNPSSHLHRDHLRVPRRLPELEPILGLTTGGKTWVLATADMLAGGEVPWCTDPILAEPRGQDVPQDFITAAPIEGVEPVIDIQYWGHYPVADAEFELGAPVSVGLRAWSPLVPGDVGASNVPAAVLEVRLRAAEEACRGTLALNFPGPDSEEARSTEFTRRDVAEDYAGVLVSSPADVSYLLGVIGDEPARLGGGLGRDGAAWARIADGLPQPTFREEMGGRVYQDGSAAAAVDFELGAGQEKVVRFLLAWHVPTVEGAKKTWEGIDRVEDGILRQRWLGEPWGSDTNFYTQMYAARYHSAVEVARRMAEDHQDLLRRVLDWQEAIYTSDQYPVWLRDSLVNNLALIAEDSHWFQPRPPLGDASFPDGAFALNESPRGCPHMSCNPCDWYGNHPIVFFYPELSLSNLRLYKEYQLDDGEIPFALGKIGDLPDMVTPEYYWQVSLNGTCYVDMVDRQWQRTGDDAVLREFYDSVKRCNTYTMDLKKGPGGPISMPEVGGMEWFEFGEWAGMAAHVGGMRLAQLRMMVRMAEAMGDTAYVEQCREWLADGVRAMEEDLWTGSYYLNFWEKETGKKSDDVMGYQLDGEWTAEYHGTEGAFRADRVKTTLDTIRRCNVALTPDIGAANFARPDGSPLAADTEVAAYGLYAMFPPELVILGMTYIYAGDKEFGLDLVRKHWENLVLRQGHGWDLPNVVRGDSGERVFGTDYYQNMILWCMPAALDGQDLKAAAEPGGLIDRVIQAGKAS